MLLCLVAALSTAAVPERPFYDLAVTVTDSSYDLVAAYAPGVIAFSDVE
jgi:hypothetical protein